MDQQPHSPENDPLGLDAVDREIRIEKLRNEIDETVDGEMFSGKISDCDPKIEESFLEHVLAIETHGFVRPLDILSRDGFDLPSAKKLDDEALTAKLRELIDELGRRRMFLSNTDHLSDRELYIWLCEDALREETMGFGLPFGNFHLDVLGSCNDADLILQMRYYATEEERAQWAADWPDFQMPPCEKPPHDRDRHLPKASH